MRLHTLPLAGLFIALALAGSLPACARACSTSAAAPALAAIPCGDLPNQAAMNDCQARRAQLADRELNATYQALLARLKDNRLATEKAIAAQRAWLAFRDAELSALWPVGPQENVQVLYGSVHPFCYDLQPEAMTRERTRALKARLNQTEGDVCASA